MSILPTLLPYHSHRNRGLEQQRGAVAIIVAVFLLAMIGTAAFAIDIGRWFVVKNELQNAADAAALAGAGHIYPPLPTGPNWTAAEAEGASAIGMNTSEKQILKDGNVESGYWNWTAHSFALAPGYTKGPDDLPAVRVTLARKDGENWGPMAMTFGRVFGTETMDASATATAVVSIPGQAGLGTLAPYAVSSCMFESSDPPLWDPVTQSPVGDPPPKFFIASGAAGGTQCNGCSCGQWTTFDKELNNVPPVRDLIENGNTSEVYAGIGDEVNVSDTWIQPGVEATLYDTAATHWTGEDIRVAVVDNEDLGNKGFTPVLGFACLHVYQVIKNGNCKTYEGVELPGADKENGAKCIVVSFSDAPECKMPGGGQGGPGPYTGVSLPPRLVQ